MYAFLLCRARARPGFGGAGRGAAGPRRGGACGARLRCRGRVARRVVARAAAGVGRQAAQGSRTLLVPGIGGRSADAADRSFDRASADTGRHRTAPWSISRRPHPAASLRLAAVHPIAPIEDVPRPEAPRTGDKTRSTIVRWGRTPQPGGSDQPSGLITREKDARQNQHDTGDDSPIEIFPEKTRTQNQRGNRRHVRDE